MRRGAALLVLCAAGERGRSDRARHDPSDGRAAMTAPVRHPDPIIVDVALGDRAYEIVIGRGVLASLGPRIAQLRPGVRSAVVTDRTVAGHWLVASQVSLVVAVKPTATIVVVVGEGW